MLWRPSAGNLTKGLSFFFTFTYKGFYNYYFILSSVINQHFIFCVSLEKWAVGQAQTFPEMGLSPLDREVLHL
jgi:hypothetical protein